MLGTHRTLGEGQPHEVKGGPENLDRTVTAASEPGVCAGQEAGTDQDNSPLQVHLLLHLVDPRHVL